MSQMYSWALYSIYVSFFSQLYSVGIPTRHHTGVIIIIYYYYYYYAMLGSANALHEGRNVQGEAVGEKGLQ
jgi:hypothetical protein